MGSTLLYGRAGNHSVTELPPEHPVTFVPVGLCREEGLKEVAVWEEQSFARRDISCYDLRGREGSLVLGAREIKNQWELLLQKNSERCWFGFVQSTSSMAGQGLTLGLCPAVGTV